MILWSQLLLTIYGELNNVTTDCLQEKTLFEGDIVPTYGIIKESYGVELANDLITEGILDELDASDLEHRGTAPQFNLWNEEFNNNEYYVIPVYIDPDYTPEAISVITKSLKKLMRKTGVVRFRFLSNKPTNGRSFLNYSTHGSTMCASYVGRIQSAAISASGQKIWLAYGCLIEGIIQHETLHALGFWHEQSRPDRDEYVDIHYNNIHANYLSNFQKQKSIDSLGGEYDYNSVMHYSSRHFSKNGASTITAKGNEDIIGQRYGISGGDKLQVRLLYQCSTGPRTYPQFQQEKCSDECKCGHLMRGCSGRNSVCKGRLICEGNQCVKDQDP